LITLSSNIEQGLVVITLILGVGVTILAIDAVLTENKFEFFIFLITSTIVMGYISFQFFEDGDIRTDIIPLTRFILGILFGLINYIIGFFAYRDFGWRMYKKIGAEINLVTMYQTYQMFISLLKIDLVFNIVGVAAVAIFFCSLIGN